LACAIAAGTAATAPAAEAAPYSGSAVAENLQVNAAGKSFAVSVIHIDLSDPALQVTPVTAANGIGYDEDFVSMAERTGAVAAVNGTFFNSYEKDESVRYPNGLLVRNGEIVHSGENQTLIVTKEKTAAIRNVLVRAKVDIGHN